MSTTPPNTRKLATNLGDWRNVFAMNEEGRRKVANYVCASHWDDLRFPVTAINPPGAATDPDYEFDTVTLDFPDNRDAAIIIAVQLPHVILAGGPLRPHVHWRDSGGGYPYLELEYKLFGAGDLEPAAWTVLSNDYGNGFTYSSGNLHQVTSLGTIETAGVADLTSALLLTRFWRKPGNPADTLNDDFRLWEFDVHYLSTGLGTEREF